MKQFKLFFACALMSLFSLGQVWADTPAAAGTTLFSEDFSSYSANDVPSGSVTTATGRVVYGGANVTYTCTDGGGTSPGITKIYADALATGTSPEILVGKYGSGSTTGGTFSITGIPSGGAQEITVSFKQNKQKLKVAVAGTGYTSAGVDAKPAAAGSVSFDITVADGAAATFDLTFSVYSSNVRVDDILVTVKTAGEGAGTPKTLTGVAVSGTPTKTVYNTGDNFDPAGLTVTGTYSDASTAPISSGITWAYTPSQTLALNQTSIGVTATVSEITSAEYNVTGLTVAAAPTVVSAIEDIEDGASYYIRGVRSSGAVVEYLKFTDGTAGATISGTSASSTAEAIAITFNKVSDGVYQLVTPEGLYVQPGASNGKIALSTTETTCNLANTTKTWDSSDAIAISTVDGSSNTWIIQKNTSGTNFGGYKNSQYDVTLVLASAAATVAKPTISGDENFVTSTTVTLACSTTGADIYYTTDGSDPKSGTIGTSFSLTETATVRAIAKLGSDWSAEATKTFTKVDALTTMDAIFAAATTAGSTATDKYITFNNWVVSAVSGNNAFVTDGTKGFIIYQSGHGFEVGDILSGTAACKVQLYKGSSEITSLTKTTDGLTVTPGGTAAVNTKTIDQLGAINTGAVVTIENVTYDGTNLSDGANTIKPYNKLFSFTMENGKEYNVTGVIDYYDALQIMPRSAADVEEVTAAGAPEAPTFTPAAGTYTSAQSVTLSCETDGATIYYTTNGDTPDDGSTPYTGAISVNEDMTIKAIAYKAGVPSAVATAAYVINLPLTTMDAIFAKATAVGGTATSVTVVFDNWVVSGVSTNGKNVYLTDGTKGLIIYDGGGSMGFSVGDILSGTVDCKVQLFNGASELTTLNSSSTGLTVTTGGVITPIVKTIDALSGVNTGAPIIVNNVQYNGTTLSDGVNTIKPYNVLFAYGSAFESGHSYNVTGIYVQYNTTKEIAPRSAADIDEIVLPDPELSYSPATLTIQQGDAWSAPTFNNPNGVTIASYASNNESVATVTDGGVIALAGGIGTATITAHFGGNATYAAADATYTITVNEAGVYSMSFDLTRASYDAAADEEVVWNSNVVTITAQKNTGTKVTNYLAGNYSSGTLIAETRLYENNILAFTPKAGVTITKVEWHATAKAYAESLAKEGTTTAWTNATAALDGTDDKLVIITPSAAGEFSAVLGKSGSNKGTRALSVVVFYTAESEKAKLTASISIDDMNMAVGDDDILLSAIAATSNPNKKAISYEVTSGTAVTIEGTGAEAALHAAAEGSATITATIPDDLGNYTGATTTFTITVAAAATLESIAIDGTATELEYTEGQSFNPAGLTVMGHYSNGSDAEITSGIAWTFDPDPLTEGITSVSVTATVESLNSPAFVVNGLTVSAAAPAGDDYIKVTASQTDWSGDYILVYEDGTDAYVWNGDYSDAASNYASATISSNTIAKPAAAAVITIAPASTSGKYTLQVNGDKYFQDNGSNAKLIFTDAIADAAEVTISYETDWTKLLFSERCIRFNSTAGQTRFRFYGESNQQAIQLYKKDVVTPPAKEVIRDGLSNGKWGTLCPKQTVENVEGAAFYQIAYLEEQAGLPYNMVWDAISGTTLTAGQPYFFIANATEIRGNKTGAELDAAGAGVNGFYGWISPTDEVKALTWKTDYVAGEDNTFVIYNNEVLRLNAATNLKSERCYININSTEPSRNAVSPMPGRDRIRMSIAGVSVVTGMEEITNDQSQMTNKVIIDGHLYILRGEKMYDTTGRMVK